LTLRLRLVVALVVLLSAGLGAFGIATYAFYSRSEYEALDTQIRNSVAPVDSQLDSRAGFSNSEEGTLPGTSLPSPATTGSGAVPGGVGTSTREGGGRPGGPPIFISPSTFAEFRSTSGKVVAKIQFSASAGPVVPSKLNVPRSGDEMVNLASSSGSGSWRGLILATAHPGVVMIIAVPATEVTNALHRFLLIEASGAAILVVVLSVGASLVLRRGLRPLELMAHTASSITSGDMTQRVDTASSPGEVSTLGAAINTMLDDIQAAFAERDATENRLRQFLANASHELRTPLTSIQGFAELFRISGEKAKVDLPTILRRIEQEAARMKLLVEDLLTLARLDETRTMEHHPVDLAVLAADACSDATAMSKERPITLDAPDPVVVSGDEAQLRQAITNLVANAIKHTPPRTAIKVSAKQSGGFAELSVDDSGPGLTDDALAHVFDRFWQADEARTGSGAGLGLAIVAGIAAQHHGRAAASNNAQGGAHFSITVPLNGARPQRA
jgi:two-component system OmpR family sensor kinase